MRNSAEEVMVAFKHVIDELSDSLCRNKTISIEKDETVAKLFTSITSTMSDGGAVNPPFNRMLANIRDDFLPGVMENWDSLSEENKSLSHITNYFCKMH